MSIDGADTLDVSDHIGNGSVFGAKADAAGNVNADPDADDPRDRNQSAAYIPGFGRYLARCASRSMSTPTSRATH